MKTFNQIAETVLIGLVRVYQAVLSKLFPPACRHIPSCSNYAIEAIEVHGPVKGTGLAVKRIFKCHPLGTHGYDPVPVKENHAVKNL